MAWVRRVWLGWGAGLVVWLGYGAVCDLGRLLTQAAAQSGVMAPPQTAEAALEAMSDAAGVIFTGSVTAVRRVGGGNGVVEVDFAVKDAIRGVRGSTYTMREWAGLWPAGDAPFRVGQRYLMLLHTPNQAGLSSPVGGPDGAIPIRGSGPAVRPDDAGRVGLGARSRVVRGAVYGMGDVSADAGAGPNAGPGEIVDLGWVATRVVVPLVYRSPVPGIGARPITVHVESVIAEGAQEAAGTASNAGLPAPVPAAVRSAPYGSTVSMLRGWVGRNDAR